ncbi:MAG: hypothetical protein WCT50_01920 [Patescibacteria group bacterium]
MKKNIGKIIIVFIMLVVAFFLVDTKTLQVKIKEFSIKKIGTEFVLRIKNNPEKIGVYCGEMSSDWESCKKSSICKYDDPCSISDSQGMYCFGLGMCIPK